MYQWKCSPILCVVCLWCCSFTLLCKNFLVWCSPICSFILLFSLPWVIYLIQKLLQAISKILLPMFSSAVFMVSGLTFKFLIHFAFIFVCGVKRWSGLIFLHVSVQFSQNHSLNKLSLTHGMCLLPLSNINWL